jgi:hypothetical protein
MVFCIERYSRSNLGAVDTGFMTTYRRSVETDNSIWQSDDVIFAERRTFLDLATNPVIITAIFTGAFIS